MFGENGHLTRELPMDHGSGVYGSGVPQPNDDNKGEEEEEDDNNNKEDEEEDNKDKEEKVQGDFFWIC